MYIIVYVFLWIPSYLFLMATYNAISEIAGLVMIGVTLMIFRKAFFVMYPSGYYWSRRNNFLFIVVFLVQVVSIYVLSFLNDIL